MDDPSWVYQVVTRMGNKDTPVLPAGTYDMGTKNLVDNIKEVGAKAHDTFDKITMQAKTDYAAVKANLPQIVGAAMAASAAVTYTGSLGNFSQLGFPPRINMVEVPIQAQDYNNIGRPVMQVCRLGDLSGYVLVQDGDLAIDVTAEEHEAIKALLESGVIIE